MARVGLDRVLHVKDQLAHVGRRRVVDVEDVVGVVVGDLGVSVYGGLYQAHIATQGDLMDRLEPPPFDLEVLEAAVSEAA